MFEKFKAQFGMNTHMCLAELSAGLQNYCDMVGHLDKAVQKALSHPESGIGMRHGAGIAFLNLAKKLGASGITTASRVSLGFSRSYLADCANGSYVGLSQEQIADYVANPSSNVSIENLTFSI